MELMISFKKCTYNLTALRLETFLTGTGLVPIPILVSTIWLLIFTNAFRNGSVSACSTACSSAAEINEMSEYGFVP